MSLKVQSLLDFHLQVCYSIASLGEVPVGLILYAVIFMVKVFINVILFGFFR